MRAEWTTGMNPELKEQAEGGAVDQTPQRKVRRCLLTFFVSYIQKTVTILEFRYMVIVTKRIHDNNIIVISIYFEMNE